MTTTDMLIIFNDIIQSLLEIKEAISKYDKNVEGTKILGIKYTEALENIYKMDNYLAVNPTTIG
jgi:hypothetical protein